MSKERSYELTEALSRMINNYPFFAMLLLDILTITEVDETNGVQTAGTDGRRLYVNRDWFGKETLGARVFVLCHEVLHVILMHPARGKAYMDRGIGPDLMPYNPTKMNHAMDYIINAWLIESGLTEMPIGGLLNPQFTSADIADEVYCKLPDPPENDNGWDQHMPSADDAPSDTEVQRSVASAAAIAQSQGKLPAGMERLINEICEPQVDWATELKLSVSSAAGRDEASFARPNRRRLVLAPNLYLPGHSAHKAGVIVMYDDRSGSVSDKLISHFLGEMSAIVEDMKPEACYIGSCSSYASDPILVDSADDIREYKTDVGGGTHMPAIFKKLDEHDIVPECLVILTDGLTDFESDPGYPVIWVMTTDVIAPYGKSIRINCND